MRSIHAWLNKWSGLLAGSAGLTVLVFAAITSAQGPQKRVSLPSDWSHQHIVFSKPSNILREWRVQQDPRYWHQTMRRAAMEVAPNMVDAAGRFGDFHFGRGKLDTMTRDWAVSLGAGASTGTTGHAGQYPAKFQFDINAPPDCTNDYVVFPTNLVGSLTANSIVALNNLYSGTAPNTCGAGPSVYWAYNTNLPGDTTGAVKTSPILSGDGTKVAYVESNAGGSVLHLLKWAAGEGTSGPQLPDALLPTGSSWNACPVGLSCMFSITFGTTTDTDSSPFYNYGADTLYVGDNRGVLHKFTGVFNGTPTEVTTGGFWPVTVHAPYILTSPVLDIATGNIFIGDQDGRLLMIREVGSNFGSCSGGGVTLPCRGAFSVQAAAGGAAPIMDAPIVDGSTGRLLIVVSSNGAATTPQAAVVQADAQLSPFSVVSTTVGIAGSTLHNGTFDGTYLSSATGTGYYYVCGNAAAAATATLYRISLTNGVLNSTADASSLALSTQLGGSGQCSPITELLNGTSDQIFVSVQSHGIPAACAGIGCVMSITLPTQVPFSFPGAVSAALPSRGGSSGIIIDNVGAGPQQSNIYYTYLANSTLAHPCGTTTGVGCAVKATQSGLN